MTRRTLLWVPLAACLRADSDDDVQALMNSAAEASATITRSSFWRYSIRP